MVYQKRTGKLSVLLIPTMTAPPAMMAGFALGGPIGAGAALIGVYGASLGTEYYDNYRKKK